MSPFCGWIHFSDCVIMADHTLIDSSLAVNVQVVQTYLFELSDWDAGLASHLPLKILLSGQQ